MSAGDRALRKRIPRCFRERAARRETNQLRDRVLGHWLAVGIEGEWTPEKHQFFLEGSRRRWYL